MGWAVGDEVAVTLKATVPNKPASFSATPGPGKVDLAWDNPNDATITKYQYRQSADGGSSWSPDWKNISGSGATTVAHPVTGLASNTAYTFQIRAANVAAPGAATDSVTATPSPAKPVGFTAEAGDGQVTLSWTKASDASITGYQFKQGTNAWAKITDSGPATVEHTVTGLSNGTAYTFQIRAMQGAVEGAESDPVTATPVAAAAQPTGLAATANHLGATLTWTDPSDSTITAYQFRQSADGGTTWNPDWGEITGSTGTTVEHTVKGLTNGTEYTFQIRAMRGNVASVATGSVTATPGPTAPAVPPDFSATEGDGSAILSWTAADDNGAAITGYQYQQKEGDGAFGDWKNIPGSDASTTTFTVTGLTNGAEYTFKLRAVNSIGDGAETDEQEATPVAPPAQPTGLRVIANNNIGVTLRWNDPNDATITAHEIRLSEDGGATWGSWNGNGIGRFIHTVTGLTNGITYTFQIRAMRGNVASVESESVTAALTPAKPTNFKATEGDGQVTLTWDDPGDGTITGYQVKQGTGAWAAITGSRPTTVEHTVEGLTNGTEYTFQIRAMQGNAEGAESDAVTATPAAQINLWSATLTVGKNSDKPWYGLGTNTDSTTYGTITPNSFTYDGTTYGVEALISSQGGTGQLEFRVSLPLGSFGHLITLTVDGQDFAGRRAHNVNNSGFSWSTDTNLAWAVGDTVAVSLKVTIPGAPTGFGATAGPGKVDPRLGRPERRHHHEVSIPAERRRWNQLEPGLDRHLRQRGEHHLPYRDRAHRRHRVHLPDPCGECRRLERRVQHRDRDAPAGQAGRHRASRRRAGDAQLDEPERWHDHRLPGSAKHGRRHHLGPGLDGDYGEQPHHRRAHGDGADQRDHIHVPDPGDAGHSHGCRVRHRDCDAEWEGVAAGAHGLQCVQQR